MSIGVDEVMSVEQAWRSRQAESWNGDPAASWEWIASALDDAPNDAEFLLLGTATRPVSVLRLRSSVGIRVAQPVGTGLDRMAWCPGSSTTEKHDALETGRMAANVWLPSVDPREMPTIAKSAIRPHGSFLTIEGQTEWDEYYAGLSKSHRKTIRGALNRSFRGPTVAITTLDVGDTTGRLTELAEVESSGHRPHGHLLSASDRGPSFTARVISLLDGAGHLRTIVAHVGSTLGAYLVGVVAGGRYLAYTMSVRAEFRQLALGHQLFAEAIRHAMLRGEAIDLGNGDTEFKRRWATASRPLHDVFIGRRVPTATAWFAFAGERRIDILRSRTSAVWSRTIGHRSEPAR